MKVLFLDVETGGLDPKSHSLLEAAFVTLNDAGETTNLRVLFPRESYRVDPHCAIMHTENRLWHELEEFKNCPDLFRPYDGLVISKPYSGTLENVLREFLGDPRSYFVCGKNAAGFDIPFLQEQGELDRSFFRHRVIDVGTLYLRPDDEKVPDFQECLRRASLPEQTNHRAMGDCLSTLELYKHWTHQ